MLVRTAGRRWDEMIGARSVAFGVVAWVGLFSGNETALAQSAPGVQALPPIVVSRTAPSVKPGTLRTAARPVKPPPAASPVKPPPAARLVVYPTTPVSGSGID